jgi:CRISPR-associated protein Cmr4
MNESKILYLFTRTPLHVGAGSSVGAIDQPIIRERHTGFPVIPATSLKGTFADEWNERGKPKRKDADGTDKEDEIIRRSADGEWLFGATDPNNACAGALQFSEAKLLAFPIRSAKDSFAWITCPLMLQRAARDGVFAADIIPATAPGDEQALFADAGPLALEVEIIKAGQKQKVKQVVLEEYTFTHSDDLPAGLGTALQTLLEDEVWKEVSSRLVILSNGMMSFFAQNACEVAQHVRISDETGTAEGGALFNQENVPSEALFYAVLHAFDERTADKTKDQRRKAEDAFKAFKEKVASVTGYQFGGDASTGLGYCTVAFDKKGA